jgi:O-acetyl-ADP-ribose deacetylase (regulator of RNase III)
MLPETIYLRDRHASLVDAWTEAFRAFDGVKPQLGDFFDQPADAMVSPANSFGIMDGGLDLAIRDTIGRGIQQKVQQVVLDRHHGEMHVGSAEVVETDHPQWPYLIVAPTMRIPEGVAYTTHSYLAFRATLLAISRFNSEKGQPIRSVLVPGLGTGVGGMAPRRCAAQMRMAYDQVRSPARIPSFETIHATHRKLRSAE